MKTSWIDLVFTDHKDYIKKDGLKTDMFSPIDKIMKFYMDNSKGCCPGDLENTREANEIYSKLKWNNNNNYFDVINSFYIIFLCALVSYANNEKSPRFSDIYNTNNPTANCHLFSYGDDTFLKYATTYGLCDITKGKYAEKVLNTNNIQRDVIYKYFLSHDEKLSEKIIEFSSLTHCVANFGPCPDASFNSLKGKLPEVRDFLNLMIDKIQSQIDKNEALNHEGQTISIDTLKVWKKWFIKNRKKYFFDEYYKVEDFGGVKRIIGLPLFTSQSLKNPIPRTGDEVKQCLMNK